VAAGGHSLAWLVGGMVLLDLGNRASFVANQARIYALRPEARSRLNTVFLVSYFLGGAFGTAPRGAGSCTLAGVALPRLARRSRSRPLRSMHSRTQERLQPLLTGGHKPLGQSKHCLVIHRGTAHIGRRWHAPRPHHSDLAFAARYASCLFSRSFANEALNAASRS
jgi:hypothetical protein